MRRPVRPLRRRRAGARGFALAEALVALAVAAMTLSLLTGATWGLKQAADRRAAAAQTGPADWMAARRALSAWAAGLTAPGEAAAPGRIVGSATGLRLVVDGGGRPYVAALRVERRGDAIHALVAERHDGLRDARLPSDAPRRTELVVTDRPMRLLYLIPRAGTRGLTWAYETGDALPAAIALEVDDMRRLTAAIHPTVGAACLGRGGLAALEDGRCDLR